MKKNFAFSTIAAGLLSVLSAGAHDGGNPSCNWTNTCSGSTNTCSGSTNAGSCVANLSQGLVLTPTTNAPAGASGKARLIAVDDNGTNFTLLFVKTTGLTNGAYTVSLTDNTGSNTFDLGTLNVSAVTNSNGGGCHHSPPPPPPPGNGCGSHERDWIGSHHGSDDGDNNDQGDNDDQGQGQSPGACWTNWIRHCAVTNGFWTNLMNLGQCSNLWCFATNAHCWFTNTLTVGSGSFVLPEGLTATNLGVITISDSSSNVVLTGDFTGNTNISILYKIVADIIPGTATNAEGSATITYRQVNAKACGTFNLNASGLPTCQKLFLTATATDSTNTICVFTKHGGTLNVRGFRGVDVSAIETVVATDTSSNVVFSVDFQTQSAPPSGDPGQSAVKR